MATSVAEIFWGELLARLVALPALDVPVARIKREHRTRVTRSNSPAIHLVEGDAKPTENKRCDWQWEMDGTIIVYARGDAGLALADPNVVEVVARISPESTTATPYANGVRLELERIAPETEIADEDATAVNIELRIKFGTLRWALDQPATGA